MKKLTILFLLSILPACAVLQFSGGVIVNTTLTNDGTQQTLISGIEDALNTAGWTTVSGHHTATIVVISAATANSNTITVRLKTTGSNCATIELMNASQTLISQTYFLLPTNLLVYQLVGCKFQMFIYALGATPNREYVGFGTLYLPAFVSSTLTGDLGWIEGNSISDAGAAASTFRTEICPGACVTTNASGNKSTIASGTLINTRNATISLIGEPRLVWFTTSSSVQTTSASWIDGSQSISDPLIAWGASSTVPSVIYGQLWNGAILSEQWANDTAVTFAAHNWITFTESSANNSKGTLALAIN